MKSVVSVVAANSHNNNHFNQESKKNQHRVNIFDSNDNNVNNHNSLYNSPKKAPSFKRLFSRDTVPRQHQTMHSNVHSSSFSPSSTTLLQLNHTPFQQNYHVNEPVKQSNPNPLLVVDFCSKCHINPPKITIANSKGMTAEKLCSGCHILSQQPVRSRLHREEAVGTFHRSPETSKNHTESPQRTIIVVQGDNNENNDNRVAENAHTNKVEVVLPNHHGYGVLETRKEPTRQVSVPNDKPQMSKLSFHPLFQKGNSKANFEARIVPSECTNYNAAPTELPAVAETITGSHELSSNLPSSIPNPFSNANQLIESEEPSQPQTSCVLTPSDDLPLAQSTVEENRPLAFNPDYHGTVRSQRCVELPAELESDGPPQFSSKVEEIRHNEVLEHQRMLSRPDEQPFSMAPPRLLEGWKNRVVVF